MKFAHGDFSSIFIKPNSVVLIQCAYSAVLQFSICVALYLKIKPNYGKHNLFLGCTEEAAGASVKTVNWNILWGCFIFLTLL